MCLTRVRRTRANWELRTTGQEERPELGGVFSKEEQQENTNS